ncbi:MAG TPA: InlB B-repeat-containing protein [Nitrospirota bacterium]|nr:InlB B-repeat-containing protein [Nitrospirota bacterium]
MTYNGNGDTGGSLTVDANTYQSGQYAIVLGNAGNLVRTDYTLAEWNTQANGSGTGYVQGSRMLMGAANVTLYAQGASIGVGGYTVTYIANGGTAVSRLISTPMCLERLPRCSGIQAASSMPDIPSWDGRRRLTDPARPIGRAGPWRHWYDHLAVHDRPDDQGADAHEQSLGPDRISPSEIVTVGK